MKKKLLLLTALLVMGLAVQAQEKQKKFSVYAVGFYNLENLFDTCHDAGKNDYEYLPTSSSKWDAIKYTNKLHNMSKVLAEMGSDVLPKSVGCAIIGVSEVENAKALTDLVNQPVLKERNIQFVHIEGPDKRGVDCALLYNPKLFTVRDVKLVPYVYELPEDKDRATRGFLTVSGTLAGEHVTVIVNHWPSRFATSFYRECAGRQVKVVKDSLQLSYQGSWNLFDQIVVSRNLLDIEGKKDYADLKLFRYHIFSRPYLFQQEGKYKGGTKRTTAGGVWLNGYSDHLPTVIYLIKEQK